MNYNTENGSVKSARLIIIITSVVLIIAIGLLALGALGTDTGGEMLEKTEIATRISLLNAELKAGNAESHRYVTDHLYELGIGNFDGNKVKTAERYIQQNYYKPLPASAELGAFAAGYFLDNYYEAIDLSDRAAVTDAVLNCYVESIGDPYAYYRTKEEFDDFMQDLGGEQSGVGIGVQVQVNYETDEILIVGVVSGAGAEAAGILPGDVIVGVDEYTVGELGAEALTAKIAGEEGTTVRITVLREGVALSFDIVRAPFTSEVATVTYELRDDGIGYIRITQFMENTPSQFYAAVDYMLLGGAKGIVFDVRNNPGGLLDAVVEVIDYLVPDGTRIASYKIGQQAEQVFKSDDGHQVDLPMVVLCNRHTASAGELFTSAIRDYATKDFGLLDALIIGEKTYGKGVMQASVSFTDGSALTFTMAYYNPPSNVNFDGVGIIPEGPLTSSDPNYQELLALEYINRLINGTQSPDIGAMAA